MAELSSVFKMRQISLASASTILKWSCSSILILFSFGTVPVRHTIMVFRCSRALRIKQQSTLWVGLAQKQQIIILNSPFLTWIRRRRLIPLHRRIVSILSISAMLWKTAHLVTMITTLFNWQIPAHLFITRVAFL